MSSSSDKTVLSKDGTRIAYDVLGTGPALVLVEGALAQKGSSAVIEFVTALAKDFRVFSYDRRGRGSSGDTPPYSVDRELEDLAAICQAAGGEALVLGISAGAALSLEAAAKGVAMSRLVVYEAPYMVGEHHLPEHTRFAGELAALLDRDDRDGALKLHLRTVGVPAYLMPIMRLMPSWKEYRTLAHTLRYDAAVLGTFELPAARLRTIRVPTLVAAGGKTQARLKAAARAIAETIPAAQFIELPGQKHDVEAEAFAPVLRRFTGLEAPAGPPVERSGRRTSPGDPRGVSPT
jgi:pimeloyl-ACP methyl ester carboxylesterase